MSTRLPAGDPRTEVSAALPFVPYRPEGRAEVPQPLSEFAARGLHAIATGAAAGVKSARCALAMLGDDGETAAARFADLLAASGVVADAHAAYELARSLDEAGRMADATVVLAVLSGTEAGQAAGMLGLAVLSTRQGRMDVAGDLVAACLETSDRHPRALSLAGIGELQRGDRQAAHAYLAMASRIARRHPDYRAELQIAQRALLLMHLAQ